MIDFILADFGMDHLIQGDQPTVFVQQAHFGFDLIDLNPGMPAVIYGAAGPGVSFDVVSGFNPLMDILAFAHGAGGVETVQDVLAHVGGDGRGSILAIGSELMVLVGVDPHSLTAANFAIV